MENSRIFVESAAVHYAYSVVCERCKWSLGRLIEHTGRIAEITAVSEAMKHVQEHHFLESSTIQCASRYAVEVILASGSADDPELNLLIRKACSLYRALPHAILQVGSCEKAVEWAKLTNFLRQQLAY